MSDQDEKPDEGQDSKLDETADALRALAGGAEPTPAQAEEAQQDVEADNIEDDADALAGIAGRGSAPGLAADAFGGDSADEATASMEAAEQFAGGAVEAGDQDADAEPAGPGDAEDAAAAALAAADVGPVDLAAELAAHAAGETDAAAELAAAAGSAPPAPAATGPAFPQAPGVALTPEQKQARAVRFDVRTRRAHAYQFKKTMIPLLIVVSVVLLIMGTVAVFLPGGDAVTDRGGADAAPSMSPVQKYRPWLILSAFVVGPILLLGAWMFYLDVRRSDREMIAKRKQAEADAGDRP